MFKISPYLSSSLNFFRWFSAMMVVAGHLRSLLFVDYNTVLEKNYFIAAFYFLTSFGHQAVVIFFVLSGFLVGGSVIRNFNREQFIPRKYFSDRFVRLYAVLLIALPLCYALDLTGLHYFNASGAYTNGLHTSSLSYNVSERLSTGNFLSNLFMMQGIFSATPGSNGPLWSLAYEFWYYLLFPALAGVWFYRKNNKYTAICTITAVAILWMLPVQIILYFSIWLLGCLASIIKKPLIRSKNITLVLFLILLIALHLNSRMGEFICDLIISAAFCLLINSMAYMQKTESRWSSFNLLLSDFSYTLYLVHFPLVLLLLALLFQYTHAGLQMQPGLTTFLLYAGCAVLVYVFTWLLSLLTERKTAVYKNYLLGKT